MEKELEVITSTVYMTEHPNGKIFNHSFELGEGTVIHTTNWKTGKMINLYSKKTFLEMLKTEGIEIIIEQKNNQILENK